MYHPIKRTREIIETIKLTVRVLQKLLLALRYTIELNTAAIADLKQTAEQTRDAALATQTSTAYLASAERHSREQAGQRHDF